MTLTEVIIALAILGIISVPLIAVFSNSVFITQLTKRQMEINAVMQIAKVEVAYAVKNPSSIPDFDDPGDVTKQVDINPKTSPLYDTKGNETTSYLRIEKSNLADRYKYRVKYLDMGGASPDYSKPAPEPNTVELLIKLYSSEGKFLRELKADINYIEDPNKP